MACASPSYPKSSFSTWVWDFLLLYAIWHQNPVTMYSIVCTVVVKSSYFSKNEITVNNCWKFSFCISIKISTNTQSVWVLKCLEGNGFINYLPIRFLWPRKKDLKVLSLLNCYLNFSTVFSFNKFAEQMPTATSTFLVFDFWTICLPRTSIIHLSVYRTSFPLGVAFCFNRSFILTNHQSTLA